MCTRFAVPVVVRAAALAAGPRALVAQTRTAARAPDAAAIRAHIESIFLRACLVAGHVRLNRETV